MAGEIPEDVWAQLQNLSVRFQMYSSSETAQEPDSDYKAFLSFLRDACVLLRKEEAAGSEAVDSIAKQVDDYIDAAVTWACGTAVLFDFMPSFAHADGSPEIKDTLEGSGMNGLAYGDLRGALPLLERLLAASGLPMPVNMALPKPPSAWSAEAKPHPLSTPLARFRSGIGPLTANDTHPQANAIYQARCEVSSKGTRRMYNLAISSDFTCFAIPTASGWKERTPGLSYFLLDEDDVDLPRSHYTDVSLMNVTNHLAVSGAHKLLFAGDYHRIKSYTWEGATGRYKKALPKHTLASGNWDGPLAVLENGRVLRAGKGSIGYWDLSTLETHGPDGKARIGEKFDVRDTWRDDPENIEDSSGSVATGTITLTTPDHANSIERWCPHPQSPSVMLCATTHHKETVHHCCAAIDLEHGGKTETRYIGHGGQITAFSTEQGDPNVFVTACSDGFARLFDIRHRLPVLTFDSGRQSEACPAVALAHPDGIPTLFTGGEQSEQIKVWDIRARAAVYELATGNNSVVRLAWDAKRTSLWAATVCNYVDRMGNHHDYRKAKIPKARPTPEVPPEEDDMEVGEDDGEEGWETDEDEDDFDEDEDDEDEDEDEDDHEDYEDKNWPKQAFHKENYFGYMFDAGGHRLFRYVFKPDANPSILPQYGDASRGDGHGYGF